jgi:hypothetical protein
MHYRDMRPATSIPSVDGNLTECVLPPLTRRRCIDFVRITSGGCRRG